MSENNPQATDPSSQYQEILNQYQQSQPPTPPQPSAPPPSLPLPKDQSKFFKILFYFSLILFLAVFLAVIYRLVTQPSQPSSRAQTTPTTTQPSPAVSFCDLNDQRYQVGQSFLAADGCNTCTCLEDLTISCTELSCAITPTSAPTSSTDTQNWKTYENKTLNFSFQYPSKLKAELINNCANLPNKWCVNVTDGSKIYFSVDEYNEFGIIEEKDKTSIKNGSNTFSYYNEGMGEGSYNYDFGKKLQIVTFDKDMYLNDKTFSQILSTFKLL